MNFPKRGETTQRILDVTHRPRQREPETEPQTKKHPAECPKCGKLIGRGRWMHIKNCKG